MEVAQAQTKHSNGKLDPSEIAKTTSITGINNILGMGEAGGGGNRLREWPHSSRIIRVSRASGGKDRHSKVWTAKGPRDRRVRLSVATAIQFYDLQDRLGFDQPSKAVEWLIKAASDAISELPSLNSSFPETPRQLSDSKSPALVCANDEQGFDSSAELEMEMDHDPGFVQTQQQHGSNLSKSSACSSTSETSKGSGGRSFSRTEIRVKARERARERAKDKESSQPESTNSAAQHVQSSSNSFTQLLTSGIGNMGNAGVSSSPPPMNYFSNAGLMGGSSVTRGQIIHSSMHQAMMAVSPFSVGGDQHQHHELQHFPFVSDHHLIAQAPGNAPGSSNDHYNLNFSISPSSGLATFNNNRGTLQSNSLPSLLPHFQRFSTSPMDGSTLPFFLGTAVDNQHHQHQNNHHNTAQFPPGLQLCYGDNGGGLSDQKGKGKS